MIGWDKGGGLMLQDVAARVERARRENQAKHKLSHTSTRCTHDRHHATRPSTRPEWWVGVMQTITRVLDDTGAPWGFSVLVRFVFCGQEWVQAEEEEEEEGRMCLYEYKEAAEHFGNHSMPCPFPWSLDIGKPCSVLILCFQTVLLPCYY